MEIRFKIDEKQNNETVTIINENDSNTFILKSTNINNMNLIWHEIKIMIVDFNNIKHITPSIMGFLISICLKMKSNSKVVIVNANELIQNTIQKVKLDTVVDFEYKIDNKSILHEKC